jgi:hypothetical protein
MNKPANKKKYHQTFKLKRKAWLQEDIILAIRKLRAVGTKRSTILKAFPDIASATVDNVIYSKSFRELTE